LSELADSSEAKGVTRLDRILAEPDVALAGLVRALFASTQGQKQPSALFVDQLSLAMGAHIVQAYGNGSASSPTKRRTLSRRNENLAKDLIASRLAGDLTVAELASVCNLSSGMFSRAFRETTGKTPHQWLTLLRLQRAQSLLTSSQLSLADISAACGFADHSHFTRVFSAAFGASPWKWRRARLS
jgi:transcriptional regulator GlxA family with amidase domain